MDIVRQAAAVSGMLTSSSDRRQQEKKETGNLRADFAAALSAAEERQVESALEKAADADGDGLLSLEERNMLARMEAFQTVTEYYDKVAERRAARAALDGQHVPMSETLHRILGDGSVLTTTTEDGRLTAQSIDRPLFRLVPDGTRPHTQTGHQPLKWTARSPYLGGS